MTIERWQGGGDDSCDILIIGGGAAGLTLAHELRHTRRRVIVAEGGLDGFDDDAQAFYRGDALGLPIDLEQSRLRMLGGSTNHWGGRSHPFVPSTFERRPWLQATGWPISYHDLEPFFAPAMERLEILKGSFAPGDWRPDGDPVWRFDPNRLVERCWRFSPPTIIQDRLGPDLRRSRDVAVQTDCNLIDIRLDDQHSRVDHCILSTMAGQRGIIRPKTLVLAAGGVENARLLLAANSQIAQGLGNGHDLVGRFFAGHPVYEPLEVQLLDGAQMPGFFSRYDARGSDIEGMISLGLEAQKNHGTTQVDGAFYAGGGQFGSPAVKAARRIWRSARRGDWPDDLGSDLATVLGDLGGGVDEVMRRSGMIAPAARLKISILLEQTPNPESRVTLGDQSDDLGMKRPVIDWRLSDTDRHSVRIFAKQVAVELGRLNVARVRLDDYITDPEQPFPAHGNSAHHLGTTRMAASPQHGVVDPQCRLFDINNLYVAGSSVFPVSGSVHPTLNLVALTLRLAAHLTSVHLRP